MLVQTGRGGSDWYRLRFSSILSVLVRTVFRMRSDSPRLDFTHGSATLIPFTRMREKHKGDVQLQQDPKITMTTINPGTSHATMDRAVSISAIRG